MSLYRQDSPDAPRLDDAPDKVLPEFPPVVIFDNEIFPLIPLTEESVETVDETFVPVRMSSMIQKVQTLYSTVGLS